mmetsp:Transcript_73509/g.145715  ORF Transcript_73509/g.145715 Transcript_73509/m.145715 type:complete len:97 (-) Transcript_73509:3-293(-)
MPAAHLLAKCATSGGSALKVVFEIMPCSIPKPYLVAVASSMVTGGCGSAVQTQRNCRRSNSVHAMHLDIKSAKFPAMTCQQSSPSALMLKLAEARE